jgi:hypothetical protein
LTGVAAHSLVGATYSRPPIVGTFTRVGNPIAGITLLGMLFAAQLDWPFRSLFSTSSSACLQGSIGRRAYSIARLPSNQSLQLTAARTALTFPMLKTSHLYLTLGSGSRS